MFTNNTVFKLRRMLSAIFVISLIPIASIIIFNLEITNIAFYSLTMISFILGFFIYPLNLKFTSIKDYMIIPLLVFLIFSILNVVFIKFFNERLSIINLLMGIFSFGQYILISKRYKSNRTAS